ncbi:MAG TPA: glutamine synthetase family protein [Geminicoccaceae bacterium]|nr:glutamine synthetase family protein [Geminicoccaceae bacterium]
MAGAGAAWESFLRRHPDTTTVDALLPDLVGIPRGKRFTADAFAATLEGGFSVAASVYGLEGIGINVPASGLIWETGDSDRPCFPDPATLRPVPWRPGGAMAIASMREPDGRPFFGEPRAVLAGLAERFRSELGLTPVVALELEFYFHRAEPGPDGRPRPPEGWRGAGVYSLDKLDRAEDALARVAAYCAAQELPVRGTVAEYDDGQFEVNLGHVADPVLAADHAFLLKRAVRAAARDVGLAATFMAKPYEDKAGNGLHVHVSLVDRDGANAFGADDGLLRRAVAGLRATMAEAMLLFAPNANSFRRLRPGSYAPLAPTWGYDNRFVALRVPAGGTAARRIEHRTAGADANPYLALAAVLAGIRHGMAGDGLDPGPPVEGDAYAQAPPSLPLSWDAAIEALAVAPVLPDHLGAEFCRLYRVCRAAERDRFADIVTPTEYAWYRDVV